MYYKLICSVLLTANIVLAAAGTAAEAYDVVIYGGTAGGVAAAVQAARMGKSVVLIEPGPHIGGLTSGGLGATDIGNKAAIGGVSREFYRRLGDYYAADEAWKFQPREEYRSDRGDGDEQVMWTFEPSVAEAVLRAMLEEAGVEVVEQTRLDRSPGGVTKEGARITKIRSEDGRTFVGAMFIDATYEGDLLAAAGVSYHVGRESNATYDETLNGVQVRMAKFHQFLYPVDPYVVPGDPGSGLVFGVHDGQPGRDGAGDHRVQAYNFRMCLTDAEENKIPWSEPEGYDAARYELLARYFAAGLNRIPWNNIAMPNRKTDVNNNDGFSTDHIGANYDYPEARLRTSARDFRRPRSLPKGADVVRGQRPPRAGEGAAFDQPLGIVQG